jgi:para-nitrobenzyl esterase
LFSQLNVPGYKVNNNITGGSSMESSSNTFDVRVIVLLGLLGSLLSNCGDKDNGSPTTDGPPTTVGTDGPSGIADTENPQGVAGIDNPQGIAGTTSPTGTAGVDSPQGAAGTDNLPIGTGGYAGSADSGDSQIPSEDAGKDGLSEADDGLEVLPPPVCEESAGNSDPCSACIHQGLVRGRLNGTACEFLGIPYGKIPQRWAPPEPADGWSGVRDAAAFGAACIQSMDLSGSTVKSEDCLFINVWAPVTETTEALPVMVFIHGGGYTGGSGNTYPGLNLAVNGQVIVVNMNYRLGSLGFFAHPDLDSQRPDKPSGSDGIRDQQLAMRWVWDNIASFQGDPNNVTLFGESAGSSSVCIHMVSPASKGLARRFIMESGVSTSGVKNGIEPVSREEMYDLTRQMAAALCPGASDVIGCLRGLDAEQVIRWSPGLSSAGSGGGVAWVPVIEGPGGVLPDHPDELIKNGNLIKGEVIIGTNKNEYALFQMLGGGMSSVQQLRAEVEQRYGSRADEIMAIYAPSATSDANQAYVTMMTDVMFRCASRRLARSAAAQGNSVYLYSFEEGTAMHASELTYVFGGSTSRSQPLTNAIQSYWTNYATTGDPNGQGLVTWPKYDAVSDQHIVLASSISDGSGLQKAACDFWDSYLANP